jgi:predicted MFS family arabinose efflux permease
MMRFGHGAAACNGGDDGSRRNSNPRNDGSRGAGAWYALTIIVLIYSCHFLDRAVISLVAEPVRKEFGLNDSQLGLLTGFGFGLMFALAGIPIGLLVDRVNRTRLLAFMVFLWSAATAACGLAPNFLTLLAGRMAVGAAESGGAADQLVA